MDSDKDLGSSLGFWLPSSAVIISLVISTFALTRAPLFESRPADAEFHQEQEIEARLWQDPFDALERYRRSYNSKHDNKFNCDPINLKENSDNLTQNNTHRKPPTTDKSAPELSLMVALVTGGSYADEVELRRRTRYAILAGFKNTQLVPEDEQHIGCLRLDQKSTIPEDHHNASEVPYEAFVPEPLNSPLLTTEERQQNRKTILFWINEEYINRSPLTKLTEIHKQLEDQFKKNTAKIKTV